MQLGWKLFFQCRSEKKNPQKHGSHLYGMSFVLEFEINSLLASR